jgi:hypothetical protein
MSEYTFQISDHSKTVAQFLYSSKKGVTDSVYGALKNISDTANYVMSSISDGCARLTDHVMYMKSKAVNMVNTIRQTGHRSVDGALIGAGVGLVLGGPFAVPSGIYTGSVIGGIYGFSEATYNPHDEAAFYASRSAEVLHSVQEKH